MRINNRYFEEIRGFLDTIPVIDTHEHYAGLYQPNQFSYLIEYLWSDMESASHNSFHGEENGGSFAERYADFERRFQRTNKTAYARGLKMTLRECWEINEVTGESLKQVEESLPGRSFVMRETLLAQYGIKAMITNICEEDRFIRMMEGNVEHILGITKFAFPLPAFHRLFRKADISRLQPFATHTILHLDDYLNAFETLLQKAIAFGAVCLKDQSAYMRAIDYQYPARGDAEKVFHRILMDPRYVCGTEEMRILGDWLFHQFLRLAAKYDLPVQLHTGHMAGIRNDIVKTNATHLIPVLELHEDVRFDLFHGNWPYMDEILFLGKNYPNISLDLCWVQCIDPIYGMELMKRAVITMPHKKLMAFGGDCGSPEATIGYLVMARDNVACALSELIECGWIDIGEAKGIAVDWFFNNPNEFFKLGFEPVMI